MASLAKKILGEHHLSLGLHPMDIRELIHFKHAPDEIYIFVEEHFQTFLKKDQFISREAIKVAVDRGVWQMFISHLGYEVVKSQLAKRLRLSTRSLSIGDPYLNSFKQTQLLLLNLKHLYQNPNDDEILQLQHQSVKSLANFLNQQTQIQPRLYKGLLSLNFHYSTIQPLLSSLLLIGYLKWTQQFSEKEMENLFITSYFKDVGLGLIPQEQLDKRQLTPLEKQNIRSHAQSSRTILEGRLPLKGHYLDIILNHHYNSHLFSKEPKPDNLHQLFPHTSQHLFQDHHFDYERELIHGAETVFISILDTLVAMTTPRPYRQGCKIFSSLEFIKGQMENDFYQEFKLLVYYIKKFFSNM